MLVALGAGRPDGGAARSVEQAKLDADGVGDLSHDAAEGVDFADEMSFGDAADGGIAGHLRDQIDIERVERGLQAHARGGHGGFASGVAGADHDYVEMFVKLLFKIRHVRLSGTHHREGVMRAVIVTMFAGRAGDAASRSLQRKAICGGRQ